MLNRHHLMFNTAALTAGSLVVWSMADSTHSGWYWLDNAASHVPWCPSPSGVAGGVRDFVLPYGLHNVAGAAYAALGLVLFWLGSVLPDIDSRRSMLGKRLPVAFPGPHHGVTHTDWVLAVLFLASISSASRLMIFVALGAWLHCEVDGLSRAGRVRFYPLGHHKIVALGADASPCVVRTGKHRGVYRVGYPSETVTLAGLLSMSVAIGAVVVLLA